MSLPYTVYEDRGLWKALDAEIAALESNGDLTLTTARRYVLGSLCRRLDRLGLLRFADQASVALALEAGGWPPAVAEGGGRFAWEVAAMGEERLIADYLRVTEADWSDAPPKPLDSYFPLARAVLAAQAEEDRISGAAT